MSNEWEKVGARTPTVGLLRDEVRTWVVEVVDALLAEQGIENSQEVGLTDSRFVRTASTAQVTLAKTG